MNSNPNATVYRLNSMIELGVVEFKLGKHDEALRYGEQVLAAPGVDKLSNCQRARSHFLKGDALEKLGRKAEALSSLRAGQRLAPQPLVEKVIARLEAEISKAPQAPDPRDAIRKAPPPAATAPPKNDPVACMFFPGAKC